MKKPEKEFLPGQRIEATEEFSKELTVQEARDAGEAIREMWTMGTKSPDRRQ
ncbi:hypothetical protein [Alteribacter natronophilus]|uniref:hypothetical protein n=1 Tax=Alteribacter natronophilus TaxID=2583810 RepID=UPI001487537F|nr:hypothetical protein [Alteribacter natronophilus]